MREVRELLRVVDRSAVCLLRPRLLRFLGALELQLAVPQAAFELTQPAVMVCQHALRGGKPGIGVRPVVQLTQRPPVQRDARVRLLQLPEQRQLLLHVRHSVGLLGAAGG